MSEVSQQIARDCTSTDPLDCEGLLDAKFRARFASASSIGTIFAPEGRRYSLNSAVCCLTGFSLSIHWHARCNAGACYNGQRLVA